LIVVTTLLQWQEDEKAEVIEGTCCSQLAFGLDSFSADEVKDLLNF
jgi:hypothetical protein